MRQLTNELNSELLFALCIYRFPWLTVDEAQAALDAQMACYLSAPLDKVKLEIEIIVQELKKLSDQSKLANNPFPTKKLREQHFQSIKTETKKGIDTLITKNLWPVYHNIEAHFQALKADQANVDAKILADFRLLRTDDLRTNKYREILAAAMEDEDRFKSINTYTKQMKNIQTLAMSAMVDELHGWIDNLAVSADCLQAIMAEEETDKMDDLSK
jgi:hypothetical protein